MNENKKRPEKNNLNHSSNGEAIGRLLRQAGPRPAVSRERTERVRSAVHQHWREKVPGRSGLYWTRWPLVAAAAVVVILLVVAGWRPWEGLVSRGPVVATVIKVEGPVYEDEVRAVRQAEILAAGARLETSVAGRAALRLSGGALIRLDTETRAKLVSGSVLELERGTLYFDSGLADETDHPVEVVTPVGTVRDVGTQFEIQVKGIEVRLRVRDGMARLDMEEGSYEAAPGFQLSVDQTGSVRKEEIPLHGPEWEWMLAIAPPFDLEGRTLGEFLDWVSRETGLQVLFEDSSIAEDSATVILHGSVEGIRPDEAPRAVLPTCGLRHRVEDGSLIITRASQTAP